MRQIIFVNRYFAPDHSATSQLLSDLSQHLAGQGRRVCVITSRQRYEGGQSLAARDSYHGVQVFRVAGFQFGRSHLLGRGLDYLSFYLFAAWRLLWLARRDDWVVVKTDPPLLSVVVALLALVKRVRVVNWVQDLFPEVAVALLPQLPWRGLQPLLRGLRNLSLRRATANVVICAGMKARLQREGVDEKRLHVIYNWSVSPQPERDMAQPNPYRHRWQLDHRFVLSYSGNMGRAHRFESIIWAIEQSAANQAIQWLFIGGGPQRAQVAEAVQEQLGRTVQFHPYQPQERLHLTLAVADLHLVSLAPEMEGLIFPSKLCGILQAGRGVLLVADPEGEMGALVREQQCGLVFAPEDKAGLLAAIERLSRAPELCQQMGARAYQLSETHFSRQAMLRQWQQLLTP
ncbi:glycosyl transferase, group 1 [Magnetococcus marinus MC-1]|uniref:Glycosyl transferase, group 1 n=1 Tax=Magnetococcus marinus (strain ATCC BAA-1437 / JCM 17883 / MC-1) TaxID=156889 RepID=A0LAA9_MAGMM|nr:glycosyltransferase family 4 protein [Magnetococcus marinus]ABK44902.1 glycosyl transferase, group 1 [Magnetococcus marinus MC-1]